MALLQSQLDLDRCPHCSVDRPLMLQLWQDQTNDFTGTNQRFWRVYRCQRCGGLVTAAARGWDQAIIELYPPAVGVDLAIPERARAYLQQAVNTLHAPAGAVMLAASAVDAMLKSKSYKDGSLYARIDQAVKDHMITQEMARWAHEVRLDANDQRHADESVPLAAPDDAKRCVEFALALGQFIFVLPARVQRGLAEAKQRT